MFGQRSSGRAPDRCLQSYLELKSLFAEAIEIGPTDRAAWLERARLRNPELAEEIGLLLRYAESGDQFLEVPAWQSDQLVCERQDQQIESDTQIASWRVVREIASGGMGTVYLAERSVEGDDRLKQRAAIKVMRRRVKRELFASRFWRERRILAQLNHPFIARFLEGGTLENGSPYFVLDYVEGVPIKEYCSTRQLDLTDVVELFSKVCTAVAYAHQNLVVHRDLKPSNILVANDGTPRLIDFGIAKLLADQQNDDLLDETVGMGPCTLRYCSPEQVRGEQITTATDIFNLGIILYELVTGFHPFGLVNKYESGAGFELLEGICEREPRRLSELSLGRAVRIAKSQKDLEAIIFKALQKTPADRYKSAEHLLEDLHNFLGCRPVDARPANWWYRTRRLVQRHPTATAGICATIMMGLVALVLILASQQRARKERDYALQQRELAVSSARTMIGDLASTLETMSAPVEHRQELLNRAVKVFDQIDSTSRDVFDPSRSAVQVRAEVETQIVLASALEEMGDTSAATHRTEMAESQARKLLLSQASEPEDRLVLAKALLEKCRAFRKAGDFKTATAALGESIERVRALENVVGLPVRLKVGLGAVHCDCLVMKVSMGDVLVEPQTALGLLKEAISYGERACETRPQDSSVVNSYANSLEALSWFYVFSADANRFRETMQKALDVRREAAKRLPGDIGLQRRLESAIGRSGSMLAYTDPSIRKLELPTESLAIQRKLCAADPSNVDLQNELISDLANYAMVCVDTYQYQDALNLELEAVQKGETLLKQNKAGPQLKKAIHGAAFGVSYCYFKLGNYDAAMKTIADTLEPMTKDLETSNVDAPDVRFRRAGLLAVKGLVASRTSDLNESRKMLSSAIDLLEKNISVRDFPQEKAFYGGVLAKFGEVLAELGEVESGSEYIERGLDIMYALRRSSKLIREGDMRADIFEAEESLRRLPR